eukprot:TRINITY_DN24833_c0_g1_i1.p1 TRINITY_DN24833_c0_g1~~TRINITY_DN24833_c0_g1_i1.p1  ORF type:complete len:312 (+),score=101.45 TRINITY_DN24833_c0_g1_i1:135-938(+)
MAAPKASCKVVTLCWGIPLYIHFLLPLVAVLQIGGTLLNFRDSSVLGQALGMAALLYVTFLPLTVLLHELGHCAAAVAVSTPVYQILLWPLGGLAYTGYSESRTKDFIVTLGGPLTHIPLFVGFVFLSALQELRVLNEFGDTNKERYEDYFWTNFCVEVQFMQLFLFFFNLFVPAYPLDGGRLLVILLTNCCTPEQTATITIVVCIICCTGIAGYTLYLVIDSGCISCYVMNFVVTAWILYQTYNVYLYLKAGTITNHPFFNRPTTT